MAMDLDDLRDRLREARDSMSNASSNMEDVKSSANYAESEADDAYSKIDDIIDNLDAYLAIDVDQHRTILALNHKLVKIMAYLGVLLRDGAKGDGISSTDEHSLYSIGNILETLFLFGEDTGAVTGLNPYYEFGYRYSDYSWHITKKEANNG
jgi:hypothetical protein